MRALRLLLLIVLLPGLLLPGGFGWRTCGCAMAAASAPACCADAAPCCRADTAARAVADDGAPAVRAAVCCCCPEVAIPSRTAVSVGGGGFPPVAGLPEPTALLLPAPRAVPDAPRGKPIAGKPPPGARRSLPLLI